MDSADSEEIAALLKAVLDSNDDVVLGNETNQMAAPVLSTLSDTWLSNNNSEHQITWNLDSPNTIQGPLPMDNQNQIHHGEVAIETPIEVAHDNLEHSNHQTNPMDENQFIGSTSQPDIIPSDQFRSQNSHNIPIHQLTLMDEFEPQVHSVIPLQMPLHMNQSNLQNTIQVIPDMSERLADGQLHHVYTAPQNHIVDLTPSEYQWDPQNPSNSVQYNPQPQPHHVLSSLTSSQFSANIWLPNRQHFLNQPFFNSDTPNPSRAHSSPQSYIVDSTDPLHQWDQQNPSNGAQYNPQPFHELPSSLAPLEFSIDPWLTNRQYLVNQPFFKWEPPDPSHAHSAPQNHNAHSSRQMHNWNSQNVSNGVQHNPQPLHEMPPTGILVDPWLFDRQHSVNQSSGSSEAPIQIQTNDTKGKLWSEQEHRDFLAGVETYGWGHWKEISENVLKTRTSIQIGSHAQKFSDHQINKRHRKRRKPSIHDITDPYDFSKTQH